MSLDIGMSMNIAVLAWAHLNLAVHGMGNMDDPMRGSHLKIYGYEVGLLLVQFCPLLYD